MGSSNAVQFAARCVDLLAKVPFSPTTGQYASIHAPTRLFSSLQDVQEFLCYLLDRLNSELMGDKNAQNSAPASSETRAKLRKSFSSLRMSLTGKPINSIINEVFEGQLLSEVQRLYSSDVSVFIRLIRSAAWGARTAVTRRIRSWICH